MDKKTYPEPIEALILILAIFSIIIVLILGYSFLIGMDLDPQALEKETRYMYIFGGVFFLIVPLIYAYYRQYDIKNLFRLKPIPSSVAGISVIAAIALTIVADELDRLLNKIIPIPDWILEQMQPLQAETGMDWFLIILGAVIVASVAEEGLFRGFFQVTLEKKGDVTRAVLLSAMTWTIIHMNPYWAIQIFVTGVVIGYLAWRTDSVIPPIIVHGINNLLAVLFLNVLSEEDIQWYEWGDHVSPVVLVIAIGLLIWSIRQLNYIYKPQSELNQ